MILLTNKTKPKDWEPIFKEMKPYLDKLGHDVEIKHVNFNAPREEYSPGKWGVNKAWLKSIAKHYISTEHERFLYHDATFKVEGSYGWFNRSISTPDLMIKQAYRPLDALRPRYSEFHLDVARTIVHELCHSWAFTLGIKDETHKYQKEDNLMAFVDKIVAERDQGDTIKKLMRTVIELLKRKLDFRKDNPIYNIPVIVHHSASLPTASVKNVRDWSDDYYNTIIRQGKVTTVHNKEHRGYQEVCVVGQFVPEYTKVPFNEPSEKNLKALSIVIDGREYMGHNEAIEAGVPGKKSACPGVLLDRYRKYVT